MIFSLSLFGIQCDFMLGVLAVFICAMFCVLCSRVCVGRVKGTISKLLCICYHQVSIVVVVCSDYFYFHCTRFSLNYPRTPFCCCCMVFTRLIEIMNQI